MSEVPPMLQRLAAETAPVESDAPEADTNTVPYDVGLQADLVEHGPEALREFGMIVVRGCQDPARYNSAVWYALSHGADGGSALEYELRDGCVIITDPGKTR